MADPHDIVHQLRMQQQGRDQNSTLAELVSVLNFQAESARRSQRAAWLISGGSLLVAAGSLACAIITIVVH
jgi:predicted secreted protein